MEKCETYILAKFQLILFSIFFIILYETIFLIPL